MLAELKPADPSKFVYHRTISGEFVDPIRLVRMYRQYNSHRELELIEQLCARSGEIAVSTKHLTRRQREKYKDSRIMAGNSSFYLFNGERVPADIGAAIELEKGVIVYS